MNVEKELLLLFRDEGRMERYRNAIAELREIGAERILRAFGESPSMDVSNPRHMEISATLHIHSVGYFDALNAVFDLRSLFVDSAENEAPVDFGADEMIRAMGYTNE